MIAAYAFTNYQSQGQTLPYVIIDIAKSPTGGLDLFNLYVALSRSSGRESIRLLQDFDNKLFQKSHDSVLLAEDDRPDKMDRITKVW
jgi:ATP-dependent exoDNAse (exonuclease V) alpha subunit